MANAKIEAIKARHYVRDALAGLAPSDALYGAINDAVAANSGTDISHVSDENIIAMADAIRKLRA